MAGFSVFEDAPNRQVTEWGWRFSEEYPTEDEWDQSGNTEHRLRNISPLIYGDPDAEEHFAYQYTRVKSNGEMETRYTRKDVRRLEDAKRVKPLAPKSDAPNEQD